MTRLIIFIHLLGTFLAAQPTGREIMEKLDQIKKPMDIQTRIKMTSISMKGKKESSRSRVLTSLEKRYEDGQYNMKSLLRFLEPKEVKGTGFLTWDKIGFDMDDQWLSLIHI